MKLTREAMAHYLDPSFKNDLSAAGTAGWEVLGDDIEEMSMEMNPDTEQKKNILGETKTVANCRSASGKRAGATL